jgi:cytochrome P450 family 4
MWRSPLLGPLVLVLVLLVVLCRFLRSRARTVRLINRIPGPPYLPIIGNTIEMNVEHDGMASFSTFTFNPSLWSNGLHVTLVYILFPLAFCLHNDN